MNVIEYSYIINLGVLSSGTFYTTIAGKGQVAVVFASVSIAFTQFVITVTFHALKMFRASHHCNWIHRNLVRKLKLKLSKIGPAVKKLICKQKNPQHDTQSRVHLARIELRESLLEYCSEFN